jgi:NAD(P) transhydrogenase subunit alpha
MEDRETERGYAEILEKIEQERQNAIIEAYAAKADIIIATALIPGKKAPQLLSEKAVALMKPGSVIVDLASKYGGNCALTVADKRLQYQGITIVGDTNMAGLLAKTASELYANNLLAAVRLLVPEVGSFAWNREDEIVQQALLCHEGAYLPFQGVA